MSEDDLDELGGLRVPSRTVQALHGQAHGVIGLVGLAGDDVPARPALTDVLQARNLPRHLVGVPE